MSFTERIHNEFKQMSTRHLLNCITALFILLFLLVLSSLWLASATEQKPLALSVHILLITSAFIGISFIALNNQKKQTNNSQQQHKAQQILLTLPQPLVLDANSKRYLACSVKRPMSSLWHKTCPSG